MASKLTPVPPAADTAVYPTAPRGLSRRGRDLWRRIVSSKPPTWWDAATLPLLAALVAHAETLEHLQAQFDQLGDLSTPAALARLEQLSRLRDREAKALASLSTKLRLTPQSRYEPVTAARRAALAREAGAAANPFTSFTANNRRRA